MMELVIYLSIMLFQVPQLDAHERDVLGRIDQLKNNLGYSVQRPRRWEGLLRRLSFARAIQGSNSIEGFHVTVEDALAAAEGDEPLDAQAEDWQALLGYRAAMTYVLQLADDDHFRYSADLLRALHFMMLQYDLAKHPGRWRPGRILVVNEAKQEVVYRAPESEAIPGLIGALVENLNAADDKTPSIIRAAMGHLNLAMIHPFLDGNGRMARCLQTLILARTGTLAAEFSSIEEYLGRNTAAYYDVLGTVGAGSWNPGRNTRAWIRFCLNAHFQQATTLLRRMREMHRLWDALETEARKRALPERCIFALSDAAIGLRIRNVSYRKVAEISDQVASRDLKMLVDEGLLVSTGEKRGRFYRAAPQLLALRAKHREKKKNVDPFSRKR